MSKEGSLNSSLEKAQHQHAKETFHLNFDESATNSNMALLVNSLLSSQIKILKNVDGKSTIKKTEKFNAIKDAKTLRKAMKGLGTDEQTIINILCHRTSKERLEIMKVYLEGLSRSLKDDIISDTSGDFKDLIYMLLTPSTKIYVIAIHEAFKKFSINVKTLIEILCMLTNFEINAVKADFEKTYNESLEAFVQARSTGKLERLLLALIQADRHEMPIEFYQSSIESNTKELHKPNEETFTRIFSRQSYEELLKIFQEYKTMFKLPIEEAIKKKFSGYYKTALLTIVHLLVYKNSYYASRLYKSMAGLGTDEKLLNRIIITRSETDLKDIKDTFGIKYGKSLAEWIKDDTSGDYTKALLALIGE